MQSEMTRTVLSVAVMSLLAVFSTGCETGGQTGALAGAGIGALAGQAIGGDTGATLVGAAVGTGIGYIIGNEADKKKAAEMNAQQSTSSSSSSIPTHSEVGNLADTRWNVISVNPSDYVPAFTSKIVEFRQHGRVITTTTNPDGSVDVFDETYRVVGSTLIVNKPGYMINARYSINGNELVVSAEDFSAVLERV